MRKSSVRSKWLAGQPALCIATALNDPTIAEVIALFGFDCIWLDMEHTPRSMDVAREIIRATRSGNTDVIARPGRGEFMKMQRFLEAGATGIMYPRCADADEAGEVVANVKFAPLGRRGCDSGNADGDYAGVELPQYIQHANEQTFLFIQVEDSASLDQVDKIARVKGVDGIFFGPGDFSVLAGIPGQMDHPLIADATKRIASAAKAAGKRWGMPGLSIDHVRHILELGASFMSAGSDLLFLRDGLASVQHNYGPLGFSFHIGAGVGVGTTL